MSSRFPMFDNLYGDLHPGGRNAGNENLYENEEGDGNNAENIYDEVREHPRKTSWDSHAIEQNHFGLSIPTYEREESFRPVMAQCHNRALSRQRSSTSSCGQSAQVHSSSNQFQNRHVIRQTEHEYTAIAHSLPDSSIFMFPPPIPPPSDLQKMNVIPFDSIPSPGVSQMTQTIDHASDIARQSQELAPRNTLRDADEHTKSGALPALPVVAETTFGESRSSGHKLATPDANEDYAIKLQSKSIHLLEKECLSQPLTIALIGADSPTAKYFVRYAADAGYFLRVFIPTNFTQPHGPKARPEMPGMMKNTSELKYFRGLTTDTKLVKRWVSKATFVVCFLTAYTAIGCNDVEDTKTKKSTPVPGKKHEKLSHAAHEAVTCIQGTAGKAKIAESMQANEKDKTGCETSPAPLTQFFRTLYPILSEETRNNATSCPLRLVVFQANNLSGDGVQKRTPMLARSLRFASRLGQKRSKAKIVYDHDSCIRYIVDQHSGKGMPTTSPEQPSSPDLLHFSYLITRPPIWVRDSRDQHISRSYSRAGSIQRGKPFFSGIVPKLLVASKSVSITCEVFNSSELEDFVSHHCSILAAMYRFLDLFCRQQPGPFPVSHAELAKFTLDALQCKRLYNSCPYVVRASASAETQSSSDLLFCD
jgi:hypothetical protein